MDLNTVTEVRSARTRADLADLADLADPGTAILAGGTWLFSTPQPHLRTLVDLTTLDWPALTVSPRGLEVAATCTIGQLAALPAQPGWAAHPLLARCAAALVASAAVCRTATVGGNVCLALPAGAMTSLASALEGTAEVWTAGGSRHLPVAELVTGPGRTCLAPGEVLRALHLPERALRSRTALRRTSLSPVGRSASVVIGRLDPAGALAVHVTAATPRPVRLDFPGVPAADELRAAVEGVGEWFDDVHGAPDWRRAVTAVLAEEVRAELARPPAGGAGGAGGALVPRQGGAVDDGGAGAPGGDGGAR
ncbi:FAD binding domain-containing protein [Kineococcus gypseus]|uniref:FAD binding domain-containing protein n=1 Tax=Kineococcus gypseus TaxID=1637102 RepID=UPI003D7C87C7